VFDRWFLDVKQFFDLANYAAFRFGELASTIILVGILINHHRKKRRRR